MDDFSKTIHYNALFNIYSELLSDRQKDILEQYYGYNLSISEIAEDNGISRAAVEDAIQKGIRKLDEFESKLGVLATKESLNKLFDDLEKANEDEKPNLIKQIRDTTNGK